MTGRADLRELYNADRVSARLEEADRLQQSDSLAALKIYDDVLKEAGAHEVTDEQLSKKLASAEASRSALHQNSQAEKHRRAEEEASIAAERKRIALARTPLDGDVTIEFDVTELPDHRVTLHGTTNLPTRP